MRARVVGIWVSGLLASAIVGMVIGNSLDRDEGGGAGVFAGLFAFTCVRLWLGDRPQHDLPIRRFKQEGEL